jgi:hypothetical protein
VSLSNKTARKFLGGFFVLIECFFPGNEESMVQQQQTWRSIVQHFSDSMVILRSRHDVDDDEIEQYQELTDQFYITWLQTTMREGITNYIHMAGAGHIMYYLKLHRNLYKFSQQGWESHNAKIKTYFFRHTQHGGNDNRKDEATRTYLKQILFIFQRELLWISGIADEHFSEQSLMDEDTPDPGYIT